MARLRKRIGDIVVHTAQLPTSYAKSAGVLAAADGGVKTFVETGAGKQLSGMVKRNAPEAETVALNVPADLEAFAKSLG